MGNEKASWKEKIDPAFDQFIKIGLELLEAVKLPANEGYLYIDPGDPHFELLSSAGFPDFISAYAKPDENALAGTMTQLMSGLGVGEEVMHDAQEIMRDFVSLILALGSKNLTVIGDTVKAMAANLDEEGRIYYENCFETIADKDISMTSAKQKEIIRFIISNIFCLLLRRGLPLYKHKNSARQVDVNFIQHFLPRTWAILSLVVHEKTIGSLYKEAKDGKDESLFKLIQIDKSLFDHDWVRVRIRRALYSGDGSFFRSLGKSIQSEPLKNRRVRTKEYLVLSFLWDFGLYRLTVPELLELFNACDLAKKEDEVTFRKFRDRFIKERPKIFSLSSLFP